MKKKIGIYVLWAMTLSWMFFIFLMSDKVAVESNSLSKGLTDTIIRALFRLLSIEPGADTISFFVEQLNYFMRKAGHTTEFMILGILTVTTVRKTFQIQKIYAAAFIICAIYALSDEFHQLFVPGRSCLFFDVVIDCCGAAIGVYLVALIEMYKGSVLCYLQEILQRKCQKE